MKSYKRMALISAITLVCVGCLTGGAWLVFEGSVARQALPTALYSALGAAGARVAAPAPLGVESRPSAGNQQRVVESYGRLPLSFEANTGQTDSRVKFLSHGRGYTLFLTGNEAVLTLRSPSSIVRDPLSARGGTHELLQRTLTSEPRSRDTVLRMRLVGAHANAAVTGRDELPGKANYFIGNDPKKWRTNVPTYSRVRYQNVYPGIDLVYYGNRSGQLQYDFVVAPGADPQGIALAVGADGKPPWTHGPAPLQIARDGDLVIPTKDSEVRFHKPVVYQAEEAGVRRQDSEAKSETGKPKSGNRHLVEGHFILDAQNRVRFALGPYDHTRPLVIDPALVYSTYLGGNGLDSGNAIAVDSSGNAYVTGYTCSNNFPTKSPHQAGLAGGENAFVAKLSWASSKSTLSLVYSTYLGGAPLTAGYGIAVDSSGNAYVTGWTSSKNFPTVHPFQASLAGSANAFVTELNSTGSALIYSTYLGGSGSDGGNGIALDSSANAYVTGYTTSSDFPTANPIQASLGAPLAQNVFVTELNWYGYTSTLSLVYSTYLGGSKKDSGQGIAVDSSGNAYVTGYTTSPGFPTAPIVGNLVQSGLEGSQNAFVAELNWDASASPPLSLVYSTYLGGSNMDQATAIAVDTSGNAYVTGLTASTNFPTLNAYQEYMLGVENAFVAELNWAASTSTLSLVYSTCLGGFYIDYGYGIAVDSSGNAYVTGYASSDNFPTVYPLQKTLAGSSNAFVAKLNWTASASPPLSLVYSTYLGGNSWDSGRGIAVDSSGNVYVTGYTNSSNFPTAHPLQAALAGASDAFVAKISSSAAGVTLSASSLTFGNQTVGTSSASKSVTLTSSGASSLTITSIATSGDFALVTTKTSCPYSGGTVAVGASCTINVDFTPKAAGARSGSVTISDNAASSPQSIALSGTGVGPGVVPTGPVSTSVSITTHTPNPSVVGQAVSFSFWVVPLAGSTKTPTGSVTVSDGIGDTCTGTLVPGVETFYPPAITANGSCSISFPATGTKTLTASYSGDSNFKSSTSASVTQAVTSP